METTTNDKNSNFVNDLTQLKAFQLVQKYGQKDALQMIEDEITEKQIEVELLEKTISIKGLQTLEKIKQNILNFQTL
jgi:hypothetical protein